MSEQVKLKTVLNNILIRGFKISDEEKTAILDNVKSEASSKDKLTVKTRIYINWMEYALRLWQHEPPTKQALIFFINISIELIKNKITFVLLYQSKLFKRILRVIEYADFVQDYDTVRMYIQLLDTFTQTEFGRNWMVGSLDCWSNVFKVIPSRRYTEDLSVFLKDLYLDVIDSSELFSMDISKLILQPLVSVCSKFTEKDVGEIVVEDLHIDVIPTINLLSSVIMCISENITMDKQWSNHYNKLLGLQKPLMLLLEIIEEEELTLEFSKLLIALNFLKLKQYSQKPHEFINMFSENIIKIMEVNANRRFLDNITLLSYNLQRFWFQIQRLLDVPKLNLPYDFGVCICMYQTLSIFGVCLKVLGKTMTRTLEEDDLRDQFAADLRKKLNKSQSFHHYKLRALLYKIDNFKLEAHLSLNFLIKSLDLFNKDNQLVVFNILLYIVGDVISHIVDNGGLKSRFYDCRLVTSFIETVVIFAKNCDFTWKDVKIHMLVLDNVTDLLQVQDLPFDIVVAALKMLDVAIDKHMAPNLNFLVDSHSNSKVSIGPIGELLLKKLNCEDKEVRTAASKVLVTISESAKSKYTFFQKLILDLNICQLLVGKLFSTEVAKVRANALKCLQHLVRIDEIWDVFSAIPEILATLINSLKIETENLLRAELVNLVSIIYDQDYFTDFQVKDLFEIITRLGVHDFDVSVRINSLKFWDVVIKKLLIDEGMIDNEFPEMTFSKTAKKIVILDETEIQRRLRRLMKKLSEIGCLTVLNVCFVSNEKSEKQCVDKIVTDLLTLLEKYDIDEDNVDLSSKINNTINIVDIVEQEIISPNQFLENIAEQQESIFDDNRNLALILDEILRHNNLDDIDFLESYL